MPLKEKVLGTLLCMQLVEPITFYHTTIQQKLGMKLHRERHLILAYDITSLLCWLLNTTKVSNAILTFFSLLVIPSCLDCNICRCRCVDMDFISKLNTCLQTYISKTYYYFYYFVDYILGFHSFEIKCQSERRES